MSRRAPRPPAPSDPVPGSLTSDESARKATMIRTTLHLSPLPGRADAVLALYAERRILARSLAGAGCLAVDISRARGVVDRLTVTGLWESDEAYRGWLDDPGRAADVDALLPLLRSEDGAFAPAEIADVADHRCARDETAGAPARHETKDTP